MKSTGRAAKDNARLRKMRGRKTRPELAALILRFRAAKSKREIKKLGDEVGRAIFGA